MDKKVIVEINKLTKIFREQKVLNELNLKIFEEETLAILGKSGCGKTVLLKHIIGILKPNSGSILIFGKEITQLSLEELNKIRQKFGMVFQNSALFDSLTVEENVALPLEEHSRLTLQEIKKKVKEKLNMVELINCENLKVKELSGGMKKKVALARAIILDPKIILYDEPTSGLDLLTCEMITNLMNKMHHKMKITAVIVSHDIVSVNKIADRIGILSSGKIIEINTKEEIKKTINPIVQEFLKTKGE